MEEERASKEDEESSETEGEQFEVICEEVNDYVQFFNKRPRKNYELMQEMGDSGIEKCAEEQFGRLSKS